MKIKVTLFVVFFGIFFSNAQQKKWTLKECVEYAHENNITVKQSELDLKNAEIDKLDALGNFIPSLNGNANGSRSAGLGFNPVTNQAETVVFRNVSAGISSNLTLFDGLRNFRQLARAKLSRIASQYQLEDIKDDISVFVANNYLSILSNRENLAVAQAQFRATEQDLNRTKELVEAGVVPKGDLLEIEATAATQEGQIVTAENALRLSKIALAQLLTITDYENFDIANENFTIPTSTILENSPKEIYEKAITFRNDIILAQSNVDLAKKDIQIAKGAAYPTLGLGFNYNTRFSDTDPTNFIRQLSLNDGITYSLSVNVPVFNGFSVSNRIKRNKINLERSKLALEQEKLNLETIVNQAWTDAKGSLKIYEAAQKTFISRKEAYDYARERFNVGLMNAFDFSQAQSRLDDAEANQIRTKFDYIFNLKILEFYFDIPIYDLN